ncbi:MAG: hypothetical protein AAF533_30125 [Acidobacteriota bacterium]
MTLEELNALIEQHRLDRSRERSARLVEEEPEGADLDPQRRSWTRWLEGVDAWRRGGRIETCGECWHCSRDVAWRTVFLPWLECLAEGVDGAPSEEVATGWRTRLARYWETAD